MYSIVVSLVCDSILSLEEGTDGNLSVGAKSSVETETGPQEDNDGQEVADDLVRNVEGLLRDQAHALDDSQENGREKWGQEKEECDREPPDKDMVVVNGLAIWNCNRWLLLSSGTDDLVSSQSWSLNSSDHPAVLWVLVIEGMGANQSKNDEEEDANSTATDSSHNQ